MANLNLKQIPDALYRHLEERAAANRRSVGDEAIICLEQLLEPRRIDPRCHLAQIRTLRREVPRVFLTDDILCRTKDDGRP